MEDSIVGLAIPFFLGLLVGHIIKQFTKLVAALVMVVIVLLFLNHASLSFGGVGWSFELFRTIASLFGFGRNIIEFFLGFGTPFIIGAIVGFLFWK